MKLLSLYKWIAGTQNDFTRQFQNPDPDKDYLFNQARSFWNNLDGSLWVIVIGIFVLGIGIASYYYTSYNNKPGRHYKPLKWIIFLIATFFLTLILSYGALYLMCEPKLNGAATLEFMVAIGNALYTCAVYIITSVIWCNLLPTNAYRLFKFYK